MAISAAVLWAAVTRYQRHGKPLSGGRNGGG
jgi:hypothetical protein